MKLLPVYPMLSTGYSPTDYSISIELFSEDLDEGIWSFSIQFLCWWVTLRFRVKRIKRNVSYEQ